MEAVKETLSKDQLEAMEDFSIKESVNLSGKISLTGKIKIPALTTN